MPIAAPASAAPMIGPLSPHEKALSPELEPPLLRLLLLLVVLLLRVPVRVAMTHLHLLGRKDLGLQRSTAAPVPREAARWSRVGELDLLDLPDLALGKVRLEDDLGVIVLLVVPAPVHLG